MDKESIILILTAQEGRPSAACNVASVYLAIGVCNASMTLGTISL